LYAITALLGTLSFGFLVFVNQSAKPDLVIESEFADLEAGRSTLALRKILRESMVALRAKRIEDAGRGFMRVQQLAKSVPNSKNEVIAAILGTATVFASQNQIVLSNRAFLEALRLYDPKSETRYNQHVINGFNGLADQYGQVGAGSSDPKTCLLNERVIRKLISGERSQVYLDCSWRLAILYMNREDQPAAAIPLWDELLRLREYDQEEMASFEYSLGFCQLLCLNNKEAAIHLREALEMPADTDDHKERRAMTKSYLSWALHELNQEAESKQLFREALKEHTQGIKKFGSGTTSAGQQLYRVARANLAKGNQSAAIELLDRAILLDSKTLTAQSPIVKELIKHRQDLETK
jgi:tetratricopeptide (TPR) repeat protein